jgi:hypothetical protein
MWNDAQIEVFGVVKRFSAGHFDVASSIEQPVAQIFAGRGVDGFVYRRRKVGPESHFTHGQQKLHFVYAKLRTQNNAPKQNFGGVNNLSWKLKNSLAELITVLSAGHCLSKFPFVIQGELSATPQKRVSLRYVSQIPTVLKYEIEVVNFSMPLRNETSYDVKCVLASKLRKPALRRQAQGAGFFLLASILLHRLPRTRGSRFFHLRKHDLLPRNCEAVAAFGGEQQGAAFGLAVAKPDDIEVRSSERTTLPKQKLCSAFG